MAERNEKRRQLRKEKTEADRIDLYVADYVKHRYKTIHEEATQFFSTLRQHNPFKLNLLKSKQYRQWVKQQQVNERPQKVQTDEQRFNKPQKVQTDEQHFNNNFQLKIPLMDCTWKEKTPAFTVETPTSTVETPTSTVETPTSTVETSTFTFESMVQEIVDEGNIQPSFEEVISPDLVEEIIDELRKDHNLNEIFTDLELNIGMEVEIDDDDRLEKELL